jgi:mannose-6-phosphate isomerase-like protein (cupin superfamily)
MAAMNEITHTIPSPAVQPIEQATTHSLLGGMIAVRLRSEETGGAYGLVEQVIPAGYPGPALHVHPEFDETFYVIDGTLAMRVGDEARDAGAGTVAFIPRGTVHTFANPGSRPARVLVLVTPGGFERYFEALAATVLDAGGLPAPDRLAALGIAHGSIPVHPGPVLVPDGPISERPHPRRPDRGP